MDFKNKTYHRNILEKLLKEHAHLITGAVLDIGSKNRRYDGLFKGKVTALDLIPNRGLKIEVGDVEKGLAYPDNSFDSIICLEVFEYLENYQKAIREIFRLLKPNGHAIITIPFMYHAHQDKMRFTKEFLNSKFAGFSSTQIKNIGNAYTVIWDILRKKWLLRKRAFQAALFWNLFFRPLLRFIRRPTIEQLEDDYYSGLFIVLKK